MSTEFKQLLVIPAGRARSLRVAAGQEFAVIDANGGQVGDLFMFATDGSSQVLSASHTRVTTGRLFPAEGQSFVSELREPMATLVEDKACGDHDMLFAACDPARYALLGAGPEHRSCAQNLRDEADELGIDVAVVPQPVNLFMRVAISDGELELLPAAAAAGDRVVLRAEVPAVVVVSACPQDLSPINHGVIKDLAFGF